MPDSDNGIPKSIIAAIGPMIYLSVASSSAGNGLYNLTVIVYDGLKLLSAQIWGKSTLAPDATVLAVFNILLANSDFK